MNNKTKTVNLERAQMFDGKPWDYGAQKTVKPRAQKQSGKKKGGKKQKD
jgi:hypothetical protein